MSFRSNEMNPFSSLIDSIFLPFISKTSMYLILSFEEILMIEFNFVGLG